MSKSRVGNPSPEQVERAEAKQAELERLQEEHDKRAVVVESGESDDGTEARLAQIIAPHWNA